MWKKDYLYTIKPSKDRKLLDNEDLVYEYFSLIMRKDIRHLLHLFIEDAAVDEPFSKPEDRGSMVNILMMTTMKIYDLLRYPPAYEKSRIEEQCIECYYNKNDIMCTFRRGQEISIRFMFKFDYDSKDKSDSNNRRIKFLSIELI
jgi:hypothetical protein